MTIRDEVKEYWSRWEECSKEEFFRNIKNVTDYTYVIDMDNNKAKYMKRKQI